MRFYKISMDYIITLCMAIFMLSLPPECNADLSNDQASLISFMSSIVSDPQGALETWKSPHIHVCNWTGVRCNQDLDGVICLLLNNRSLQGTISPSVGNLKSLSTLDLSDNLFHGRIPPELGSISTLTQISLARNHLQGEIPSELSRLKQLHFLHLGSNKLVGEFPESLLCNLSSTIGYFDLSDNFLVGEIRIPSRGGCELTQLTCLMLWLNHFTGHVPLGLANSTKIEWLDLGLNDLTGELPSQILSQMPSLTFLGLSYNNFVSHDGNTNLKPFFASLANASGLQKLELDGNSLGGEIPPNIGKLSTGLYEIYLNANLLHGKIPHQISRLFNISLLNLSDNLLNGSVPSKLHRIKALERLILANNSLSGEIPSALGGISRLGLLELSRNKLSGSIPNTFANLSQLRILKLHDNQLSGSIPGGLAECINLEVLDLSNNYLSGGIPRELAGLSSLDLYLNLSSNNLTGLVPAELSMLENIKAIDLSMNKLSGTIPPQIGAGCIALEFLNLSGNHLEGTLPATLGAMNYLESLDVSRNELGGEIPGSFQTSPTLRHLNFSFNNFYGDVPNKGVFSMLDMNSFLGNYGLCGPIKGMRECTRSAHHFMLFTIIVLTFVAITLCTFGTRQMRKSRTKATKLDIYEEEDERNELKYPRITHRQLIEATGGFNSSSLIGSGRFGHVYKGALKDNTRIAVKVLDCRGLPRELSGSFKRECQILKNMRHRNLAKIITVCSKPDFKAIVFPLMSNGSLERHLYPSHDQLGLHLVQLVCICNDVAQGMAYLHHHAPVTVVHCDLKPSNILLDDEMNALVTDFGIAKLVKGDHDKSIPTTESASLTSTGGLLCGSVGYIPPEYGLGGRASTQGDVYSFGVLILEIITGKRPTAVLSEEGSSLHEWVKGHYPHNLDPIIEHTMSKAPASSRGGKSTTLVDDEKVVFWREVILELIELGLMCTQYAASTRPTMLDIAQELERLKQHVLSTSSAKGQS